MDISGKTEGRSFRSRFPIDSLRRLDGGCKAIRGMSDIFHELDLHFVKGNMESAERAAKAAIQLEERFPWGHVAMGEVLRNQGKHVEAKHKFCDSLTFDRKFIEGNALYVQQLVYLNDFRDAIRNAQKLTRVFRKATISWFTLGITHLKRDVLKSEENELPEAIAALKKAESMDGNYYPTLFNLGRAYQLQAEYIYRHFS